MLWKQKMKTKHDCVQGDDDGVFVVIGAADSP